MNILSAVTGALIFLSSAALAQSPVTIRIDTRNPGPAIAPDFSGLSLEVGSLRTGNAGTIGNMFDDTTTSPQAQHAQVITLFRELGIRNIRVGGGSVDINQAVPTNADIDAFFRFARSTGQRVIYSVRLLNGNITDDTNTVKYVWTNYRQSIDCFSIGNEPDWNSYHNKDPLIRDYPSYLADWRNFAAAITTAAPGVLFGGPDTGSNYPVPGSSSTNYIGVSWTVLFANDQKGSGTLKTVFAHNYVGQAAPGNTPQQMIDKMLSTDWVTSYYPALYNATLAPVVAAGLPYRLTESNSFSGVVAGGSNSFATALFGLDYLHWWAAHGAAGINFHNKQWVGNGPIYLDAAKNYQVYPLGYGIKAFDLGAHGRVDSITVANRDTLNLTAYAVQDTSSLFVTIINKEHGAGGRDAAVDIAASEFADSAWVVFLKSPNGAADTIGVTLGGAPITNSGPWQGIWSPVDSAGQGHYFVHVPASSAAIVRVAGKITAIAPHAGAPVGYALFQNYPNPFNPTTVISYRVPRAGVVRLVVSDLLGREVATLTEGWQGAGSHSVVFNAGRFASGVYYCKLTSGSFASTIRMVLLR